MFNIASMFILKIIDIALSTARMVQLSKERYVRGAILSSASTFFYYLTIMMVAQSNSIVGIIALCIAAFIGTVLPSFLIKKAEKDKLFIFDITADGFDSGLQFADTLRDNNLAVTTTTAYNSDKEKTISCRVYCYSKEQSKAVVGLLETRPKFKYNVYLPAE